MDKKLIKKKKDHAFGKDIYLLGCDKSGEKYWLEAPKWDCGWYWGFGYVETYTNNNSPSKSNDISSHGHIDSTIVGQQWIYEYDEDDMKSKTIKGEYIHNLYDSPILESVVFDEKQGWILGELFKTFYELRETAEFFGRGGAHVTENPHQEIFKRPDIVKLINETLLPLAMTSILKMLSPTPEEELVVFPVK